MHARARRALPLFPRRFDIWRVCGVAPWTRGVPGERGARRRQRLQLSPSRPQRCHVSAYAALRRALVVSLATAPFVVGAGGSGVAARGPAPCRPAQVIFTVQPQPFNSVTTGFSVTAKTRRKGVSCTVRGYPSVTVPGGAHGPVTVVSRPHLVGTGGPERIVTLSASARTTGGFYAIDTWPCASSHTVEAHVRFGLPDGGGADGSATILVCRSAGATLVHGPFSG